MGLEETRIRQTSRKGIIKVNSPSSEHESRSGFSSLSSKKSLIKLKSTLYKQTRETSIKGIVVKVIRFLKSLFKEIFDKLKSELYSTKKLRMRDRYNIKRSHTLYFVE